MLDPHQVKVDGLQSQLQYLKMIQQRHMRWASGTANIVAKSKHLDIIDTLHTILDQYEEILRIYAGENKEMH